MSTRRYRVNHTSTYAYTGTITASHNEVRMTPVTEEGQATLESRLRIRPLTWSQTYRDYFGTHVTALEASGPHDTLELEAISTVERSERGGVVTTASWDALRTPTCLDVHFEYLQQQRHTELPGDVLAGFEAAARGCDPAGAVASVIAEVRARISYQPGVTVATSPAWEAWTAGKGVCQDFVHATLGGVRHLGIPARYVSGYLMPDGEAALGEPVPAESHAWVEWWDGSRWVGVDPTNDRPVGVEHIVVARGRDYEDVAPFKGVYRGDADADLRVEVTITRLG